MRMRSSISRARARCSRSSRPLRRTVALFSFADEGSSRSGPSKDPWLLQTGAVSDPAVSPVLFSTDGPSLLGSEAAWPYRRDECIAALSAGVHQLSLLPCCVRASSPRRQLFGRHAASGSRTPTSIGSERTRERSLTGAHCSRWSSAFASSG
jgi:hypothetical protein